MTNNSVAPAWRFFAEKGRNKNKENYCGYYNSDISNDDQSAFQVYSFDYERFKFSNIYK